MLPLACLSLLAVSGCRQTQEPAAPSRPSADAGPGGFTGSRPYPISDRGGTPATGPGDRFNGCERVWCLTHGENYFIDHFVTDHVGWILHDEDRGDVFVPRHRTGGPEFPGARAPVLMLCGRHVHPWLLRAGGSPIRLTGYNRALGYDRAHFNAYGTRLDPCCINGLGWAFVHTSSPRQFRFHDLEEYRNHPEIGWQKPFAVRASRAP